MANEAVLRRLKEQGAVREKRSHYLVTGGDNCAEALAGAGKRCLRRLNLFGSGIKNHDHVNVLAAHHLLKGPGLHRVLAALCAFRARVRGTCSPNEAFKSPLWKAQLRTPEGKQKMMTVSCVNL